MNPTLGNNPEKIAGLDDLTVCQRNQKVIIRWANGVGADVPAAEFEIDADKFSEKVRKEIEDKAKALTTSALLDVKSELFKTLIHAGKVKALTSVDFGDTVVSPIRLSDKASIHNVSIGEKGVVGFTEGKEVTVSELKVKGGKILLELEKAQFNKCIFENAGLGGNVGGSTFDAETKMQNCYAGSLRMKGANLHSASDDDLRTRYKDVVFAWSNVDRTTFEPISKSLNEAELKQVIEKQHAGLDSARFKEIAKALDSKNVQVIEGLTENSHSQTLKNFSGIKLGQVVALTEPDSKVGSEHLFFETVAEGAKDISPVVTRFGRTPGTDTIRLIDEKTCLTNTDALFLLMSVHAKLTGSFQEIDLREIAEKEEASRTLDELMAKKSRAEASAAGAEEELKKKKTPQEIDEQLEIRKARLLALEQAKLKKKLAQEVRDLEAKKAEFLKKNPKNGKPSGQESKNKKTAKLPESRATTLRKFNKAIKTAKDKMEAPLEAKQIDDLKNKVEENPHWTKRSQAAIAAAKVYSDLNDKIKESQSHAKQLEQEVAQQTQKLDSIAQKIKDGIASRIKNAVSGAMSLFEDYTVPGTDGAEFFQTGQKAKVEPKPVAA